MSDLPDGWVTATINELAVSHGITDGPFGSNLKTAHYTPEGPRVVRLQNIGDGHFKTSTPTSHPNTSSSYESTQSNLPMCLSPRSASSCRERAWHLPTSAPRS